LWRIKLIYIMSHKFLLFILLVCFTSYGFVCSASTNSQGMPKEDDEGIILRKHEGQPSGGPRQPSSTSIVAYYSSDLLSVCASLYNAGDVVEVEFYNYTTGTSLDYEIPGSGPSVMPIGGTSGLWSVTFSLSNGDVYEGEFNL